MGTAVTEPEPLLEITNLEVIYQRAITAVQGVSLAVQAGTITAIVGTNGAGKSTTLCAVAGFMRADDVQMPQGTITFAGQPIKGCRNYQISTLGIGIVPERDKIFPTLTVEENLAACHRSDAASGAMTHQDIFGLFPRLGERRQSTAGYLSGGERQMLAISMALLNRPRLMLIDEMSLGLAPVIVEQLQQVIRRLRRDLGISFLVVEQNATTILDLADYIYVLENGRVVFDGEPTRLKTHQDFQEFYLGMGASGSHKSYRDVKQYRRKRRWFG